jgi:MHS family citrate/tricarballylate:H+ symporter-like MFS transporter
MVEFAQTTPDVALTEHPPITPRQVTAAVVGNALEFYDFTTYAYFAVQIGRTFFPAHGAFESLMLSLATFGAGYFSRPVGALVIGAFADRAGRRPAMLFSFALMGAAILGLALTPSYARIGLAAPILAVSFRLLQGFALGGEVGPTTAFLVEAAPLARRGFYGVWQSASQAVASLAGGAVGLALSSLLDASGLEHWGWRVAFIIGALVLPFGLIIRRDLPETLNRAEVALDVHPDSPSLRSHTRIILIGVALISSLTVATSVFSYMTTYALSTLHMKPTAAFGATVVGGVVGIVFTLAGGALSDRIGRKPLMLIPRVLLLLAIYPAFYLMVRNHNAVTLLTANAVLGGLSALSSGVALICLTESLRKEVRSAVLATVYAVAVAVFGGTTQLVVTWLIRVTGNSLAPAWYMMAATAIGLVAMAAMKETAPRRK